MRRVFSALVLMAAVVGMVLACVGLMRAVEELETEVARGTADAVLASAEVGSAGIINVPVTYFAQNMDECVDLYDLNLQDAVNARQFEWNKCAYYNTAGVETEMTEYLLGDDGLPVAVGGESLANRGVVGENFRRWYHEVEGQSTKVAGTLGLEYDGAASFSFQDADFHPVGASELFTMELSVPVAFVKDGKERLTITADDDTWVYVGDKLVLDMGGVHESVSGELTVNTAGEIYAAVDGIDLAYSGVRVDDAAMVRIFHANRNSGESELALKFENMVLNVRSVQLANNATDSTVGATRADGVSGDTMETGDVVGVVIADGASGTDGVQDPTSLDYVAPLGESLTVVANHRQAMVNAVVAEAAIMCMMVVIIVAIMMVIRKSTARRR